MISADGRYSIIFYNGEIYNYRDLRQQLESDEVTTSKPGVTPKSCL